MTKAESKAAATLILIIRLAQESAPERAKIESRINKINNIK